MIDAGIPGYVVKSDSGRGLSIALENLATHKPSYSSRISDVIANPLREDTGADLKKPRTLVTSRENGGTPPSQHHAKTGTAYSE